jgi:hypothetical protein
MVNLKTELMPDKSLENTLINMGFNSKLSKKVLI